MAGHDPLIGRQLGAYQVQYKLGEGGMARVYKAYHARLRRDVAIKVILAPSAENSDFRVRFEREAQLIASLEHPNIVAVYDFSEEGQLAYLVMQYVGGGTLCDQLSGGDPLAPQRAAHYALLMARALHHAHLRGIVHRDVKPQNMLVSAQDHNQLLLSDFGIARLFDNSQELTWLGRTATNAGNMRNGSGLTRADQIIGTVEYMAPEQIKRKAVDARSDVYALGAVLFQMLTGRVPFLSTTVMGLMYQHVHTPAPSVREMNPAVPEIYAQITARALEKAPEARFSSAESMALALENALNATNSQGRFPSIDEYATTHRDTAGPSALPSHDQMQPLTPASSVDGQRTAPPMRSYGTPQNRSTPGSMPFERTTTAGDIYSGFPMQPVMRPRKPVSIQMIAGIVFIVIALAVLVMRFQFASSSTTQQQSVTTSDARPFVDTFTNNNLEWIEGSTGGLTSSVSNGHYTLTTAGTQNNTYFPYPGKEGMLPKSFTLTTQIRQDTGGQDRLYGLAFYLNYQNSTARSCYAFVVASNSNYMILKYDTTNPTQTYTRLWQGQSSAIHGLHKSNELQVTAHNGTFSFKINGQAVTLKNGNTITDTTYASGQIGLMVTGPGTSFSVTRVQLAIP